MLILEGADLVGKTTLQTELLKHTAFTSRGYMPAHTGQPPKGFDHCWGYINLASRRVIMDRFHMSEFVYDRVLRGGQQLLDPEMYRFVDGRLCALGVMTVIITADDDLLRERYSNGADELCHIEQILLANDEYRDIIICPRANKHIAWDNRIHCTLENPTVTRPELVACIVGAYFRRQVSLDRVMRRHAAQWEGLKFRGVLDGEGDWGFDEFPRADFDPFPNQVPCKDP